MKKLLLIIALVFAVNFTLFAQKGTAEPDYYPMNYSGDTWSGKVTVIDESKRELTLTYKKKDKEESFSVILPKGYKVKMKDGTEYEVKLSDFVDFTIKAYYITKTQKDANGNKIKTHEAFKIKFITDK